MTTVPPSVEQPRSKGWHITLWVAQVLLALAFLMAGWMKVSMPIADLAARMVWPGDIPAPLVRFIGAAELAGALGLILPAATRIKPVLTPWAAVGLLTIMVLAAGFHVSRGETQPLPLNATFGLVAAFIAWGRFRKAPIAPRA